MLPLSDCSTSYDSASKLAALQTLRVAAYPQEPSQPEGNSDHCGADRRKEFFFSAFLRVPLLCLCVKTGLALVASLHLGAFALIPLKRRSLTALFPLAFFLLAGRLLADSDRCAVCGNPLAGRVFTVQDSVTEEKKQICPDCAALTTVCFICGLPVKTNYTSLPDGRVICARDARTAVLDEQDAQRVCREAKNSLDRLFSRFLEFPETNVTVTIVDRVHLQELFKFAGRDYVCPNVWGYTETKTNRRHIEHHISLLSALPLASFKATCAHEYAHTWLNENLSEARKQSLSRDANEGFCELVSYRLMEAQNEAAQKKLILSNAYTRGQIHLFLEAERLYGFNDIVDWMNRPQ